MSKPTGQQQKSKELIWSCINYNMHLTGRFLSLDIAHTYLFIWKFPFFKMIYLVNAESFFSHMLYLCWLRLFRQMKNFLSIIAFQKTALKI